MIEFKEALEIVLNNYQNCKTEKIEFTESLNRILAKDVVSDIDMPPFNKSAMDGYACRKEDLAFDLEQIEIIPAGYTPTKEIGIKQCSKIMTGSVVPEGANCVIMVEHTEITHEKKIKYLNIDTKENICYKAEDVSLGDVVLTKGTLIKAHHIAILASVGCIAPEVFMQPNVAIISTGSELVEPEQIPASSQIRNSNGYQLKAQVENTGAKANYFGIAEDSEEVTFNVIKNAIKGNDLILLTGGVSAGDFDFVPSIIQKTGFSLHFENIAIQPGKPTIYGTNKEMKSCFGLPGNPVSSYILFELLVKPLLLKMMGKDISILNIQMPIGVDLSRKKTSREKWMPVFLNDEGYVIPVEFHGSAHIHALSNADGLTVIPKGKNGYKKGELVHVRQI